MSQLDKRITEFIRRHHVLTVATCAVDVPWCANMFYAYSEEDNAFFFTSDEDTRHAAEAFANGRAAGSVVLETKIVGRLQGLQFSGTVRRLAGETEKAARKRYIRRFPYAAAAELKMWVFEPDYMKYTDNTLGFGKKLYWQKTGIR